MLKLSLIFFTAFPQDSVVQDTSVSIMFKKDIQTKDLSKIEYRHQQGFFCDFEDRINKSRKLNINLGVGDQ